MIGKQRRRKEITFEEWKMQKDRKKLVERELEARLPSATAAQKSEENPKIAQSVSRNLSKEPASQTRCLNNKDQSRSDSLISKQASKLNEISELIEPEEPTKLTYKAWLHKKNLKQQEKLKIQREDCIAKENRKKQRLSVANDAYNSWLIRSKYRTLRKYYPQLSENEINKILMNDLSKLTAAAAMKDVGG